MLYLLFYIFSETARPFLTSVHNFVPGLYIPSFAFPEWIDFHSPFCFKSIKLFFYPFLHEITCTGSDQRSTYILLLTGSLGRSTNAGQAHNDTFLEQSPYFCGLMMQRPELKMVGLSELVFDTFFFHFFHDITCSSFDAKQIFSTNSILW